MRSRQRTIKNNIHNSTPYRNIQFKKWLFNLITVGISITILSSLTIIGIGNYLIFYQNSKYTPSHNADSVIILGAHIGGTPLRPSLMLQYRLDKAIDYWRENPHVTIVTTGGKTLGYSQSHETISH